MEERIEQILEEQVRPFLAMHGGGVELVEYQNNKVYLKMFGGCQGCASSAATLRDGIEAIFKSEINEQTEVVDLTDHQAGENPYL